MTVYVDDMRRPFGRFRVSHMLADTTAELDQMADTIGVDRHHKQHAGTWQEHYDVADTKRALALKAGAVPITMRQAGEILERKRKAEAHNLLPSGE